MQLLMFVHSTIYQMIVSPAPSEEFKERGAPPDLVSAALKAWEESVRSQALRMQCAIRRLQGKTTGREQSWNMRG